MRFTARLLVLWWATRGGREQPSVASRRGDLAFPGPICDDNIDTDSEDNEVVIEGTDEAAFDDAADEDSGGWAFGPHGMAESPLRAGLRGMASGWLDMARECCGE